MWQVPPRGPCWEVRDRLLNADEEETEGLSGAGGLRTDAWREAGITQVNGWVWGWQKGPWHLRALHCSLEEAGRRKAQHCNSHYNDNHRSLQSLSTKKKFALENYEMSSIGVLAKAGWSSGRNAGEDTRGDIWSNWWEDTHSPLFLSPRGRTSLTDAPGLSCPLSGARGSRKWACSARPHVISSLVWPVCLM